jgi:hypothetical protein
LDGGEEVAEEAVVVEEEAILEKEDPLEGSKVIGEAFEREEEEAATSSTASVVERRTGELVKGVFSAEEEGSGVPEVTMVEKGKISKK